MKALILAAGYATRLYPLTLHVPKALLPIGERPMLDYLVREIATLPNLRDVHIVSNHKFFDQFQAWADAAREEGRYPSLSFTVWDDGTTSDADRLGAVGDIRFAIDRAKLDDDLLVAASDNFFTFPLRRFAEAFEAHGRDTLLAARIEDPETLKRFAVAQVDGEGRVTDLEEKPPFPKGDLGVYALYLYRRDTLPMFAQYLDEGNSPDAPGYFPEWLHKRREVRVYRFEGECVDIGTPEAYAEVCRRYAAKTR